MRRISPALLTQVIGTFAWLVVGATARPGVAQQVGPAPAQSGLPPLPAAARPAASFSEVVDAVAPAETMTVPQPSFYSGAGAVPPGTRVEMGIFDTMAESIFGQPDPNSWRPLPIWTLFSEGWNEAWVPSPNGSGGAPRQGWINAMDGNMYRLWFFTFAQAFNKAPLSNAYLGAFTLYTPLSRRLLFITNIPFVVTNNAQSGLPIINPSGRTATPRSQTTFGDLSFTPRVLLHETQDFSLTGEVAVTTPTGRSPLEGKTALTPAIGFWNNFAGGWVIRGGIGDLISLHDGKNTLISQLAIGQTLTAHDVPLFGDFTYYLSTLVDTPLPNGDRTSVTLTPGIRTHLGRDWYFLAGLPVPVTKDRVGEIGMIFWLMKAW
jgi:hypothetical protein